MALAFLCREIVKADSRQMAPLYSIPGYPRINTAFTAFIVDHKMRQGSDVEANQVAIRLAQLGIDSRVLQMDWTSYGNPSQLTNVESKARTLRYQALGRACRENGIDSLLFAHHSNDQHENVLLRIHAGYLGVGLKGMNITTNIPECGAIYGVDHSGFPDYEIVPQGNEIQGQLMSIESGGVTVGRPLLALSKNDLVTICLENGIEWSEDHTNKDPTLTIRNTFRHLINKEQLPLALSQHRILQTAAKVSKENDDVEAAAMEYFNDMPMTLDLRTGTATFIISRAMRTSRDAEYTVCATVLRKMLNIVTSKSAISLQSLDSAVDFISDSEKTDQGPKLAQISDVDILRNTWSELDVSEYSSVIFRRRLPTKKERCEFLELPLSLNRATGKWLEWVLWDGRYWIRVRPPKRELDPRIQVGIRFLCDQDLSALRRGLSDRAEAKLEHCLSAAKGYARLALPVIVIKKRDHLIANVHEQVVVLPTLDFHARGWERDPDYNATARKRNEQFIDSGLWLWDIRYKHVNLGRKHRIITQSRHRKLKGRHQHS